jgi:hypothetical protein
MDARAFWRVITRPTSGEESILGPTSSTLCIRGITRREDRWSCRRSGCTLHFRRTIRQVRTLARIGIAMTMVAASFACHSLGQTANSLSSVKKLFVEPFGAEKQDDLLRLSLLARLKKSNEYQIVDNVSDADAILKGHGRIWVKGHFTINSRAPAANRQPVYAGFLSIEITGTDGEPLWSCLVTPSKFSWSNITDDLADSLTQEMLRARKDTAITGAASSVKQSLAQADVNGAGQHFQPRFTAYGSSRFSESTRSSSELFGSRLRIRESGCLLKKEWILRPPRCRRRR